jgi:hypothetical protein
MNSLHALQRNNRLFKFSGLRVFNSRTVDLDLNDDDSYRNTPPAADRSPRGLRQVRIHTYAQYLYLKHLTNNEPSFSPTKVNRPPFRHSRNSDSA